MNALSRLITKCLIRQFQQAKTSDETNDVLTRTITFATGENPYISDEQVDSIVPYIPVTEPVTEPEPEIAEQTEPTEDSEVA